MGVSLTQAPQRQPQRADPPRSPDRYLLEELSLRYPGWQAPDDGPVATWEREWLNGGYLSRGEGGMRCALPARLQDVPGARAAVCQQVSVGLSLSDGMGGVQVAIGLAVGRLTVPEGATVRLGLCVGAGGNIVAQVCATPDRDEARRRDSVGGVKCAVAAPEDWVIYPDGGYKAEPEERAGWGWVAVTGGDGCDDVDATELARACGQVELEEGAESYVGARCLSNITAEGQGLAEALMWLLSHGPVDSTTSAVVVRTDNRLVAHWAMGLASATQDTLELASALRTLWRLAAARWRLRWAHVRGHSQHVWNTVADALATSGCEGEVMGFAAGEPVVAPPTPPARVPMVTGVARWLWDVTRVVEIQPHDGEIIVISRFADRDSIQLQSVPAGAWLPLRSPSGDALDDVVRGVLNAQPGRFACHLRPQALVFSAEYMDELSARDWVRGLVDVGIGQSVEEVRVACGLTAGGVRARCRVPVAALIGEDLLDVTGWDPLAGEVQGGQQEGEGTDSEAELWGERGGGGFGQEVGPLRESDGEVQGGGDGGEGEQCGDWAGQFDPVVALPRCAVGTILAEVGAVPEGWQDDGAGVGLWSLPYAAGEIVWTQRACR